MNAEPFEAGVAASEKLPGEEGIDKITSRLLKEGRVITKCGRPTYGLAVKTEISLTRPRWFFRRVDLINGEEISDSVRIEDNTRGVESLELTEELKTSWARRAADWHLSRCKEVELRAQRQAEQEFEVAATKKVRKWKKAPRLLGAVLGCVAFCLWFLFSKSGLREEDVAVPIESPPSLASAIPQPVPRQANCAQEDEYFQAAFSAARRGELFVVHENLEVVASCQSATALQVALLLDPSQPWPNRVIQTEPLAAIRFYQKAIDGMTQEEGQKRVARRLEGLRKWNSQRLASAEQQALEKRLDEMLSALD